MTPENKTPKLALRTIQAFVIGVGEPQLPSHCLGGRGETGDHEFEASQGYTVTPSLQRLINK